jgi:hypothetical protein
MHYKPALKITPFFLGTSLTKPLILRSFRLGLGEAKQPKPKGNQFFTATGIALASHKK